MNTLRMHFVGSQRFNPIAQPFQFILKTVVGEQIFLKNLLIHSSWLEF